MTMTNRTKTGSALRFLLVGGTTVLIDAGVYALLDALRVDYDLAKTISFIAGATFAYFANWRFTFGGHRNRWSEVLFVLVYAFALGINIALNALVRSADPGSALMAALAFLVATGVSAVWNFVGMSLLVFRRPSSSTAPALSPDARSGGPVESLIENTTVRPRAVLPSSAPPPIRH
jgi:putative flippase GtrA